MINRRSLTLGAGMAIAVALTAGALIVSTAEAEARPQINAPAPAFAGVTSTGETVSLADFAGKRVVLEWTNHDCPFVKKHYDPGFANMQGLQQAAAAADTVWLSVISSAPGKQGHVSASEADVLSDSRGAAPAHVILDESGDIGRLYDARTTPHMFVIAPDGTLAYDGAIDSIASARPADIPAADPYVVLAQAALDAGEPVDPASTKPYGCSVKY